MAERVLEGRRALVVGVANEHSIAWGIAKALSDAGASLAMTYLNEKAETYVRPLADGIGATIVLPLDVNDAGETQALFGVSLGVGKGEVLALLGANGAGKTTVLRSILGLTRPRRGEIRFQGRPIDDEVLSSVMAFFYMFALTLAVVTVALSMMGLDPVTAISAAAASLACVGPGFGPIVGPAGNFQPLPDAAKWLLSVTMIMGRLELLGFLVLFSRNFWRG
jgi:NAD(P)-dependent dehydrogenase (short-subunit alcohol dehydrogenase family)